MKKAIAILLTLIVAAVAVANTNTAYSNSSYDTKSTPSNVFIISLGSGTGVASQDTVGTTNQNVYGPFALSKDDSRPKAKQFRVQCPAGQLTSGDSLELSYQIINGSAITDTGAAWTKSDTITDVGKVGNVVDISTKPGKAIVFKLINIDGTSVTILKKIKIAFEATATESVNTK